LKPSSLHLRENSRDNCQVIYNPPSFVYVRIVSKA
jgi:hypothetical protein